MNVKGTNKRRSRIANLKPRNRSAFSWLTSLPAAVLLAAVLLSALALSSACAKKEPATAHREAAAEHAAHNEHAEQEGKRHDGEHREGEVELTAEAIETAGIEVQPVVAVASSDVIGATAVLELNGDRVSRVGSRVAGRCVAVSGSLGDRVKAGQVLARIDSVEVDHAWSDFLKAKAQLELATRNVKREEALFAKKVSPEKDLLKARHEQSQAEAEMLLVREKFRLLGVDAGQVEKSTNGTTHVHPLIPVSSPISGVVIEKAVTHGEVVGTDKTLFTVADLSTLWLMIDIYERDIGRIRTGMQAKLSVATYPGKEFQGRISYIGDVIDERSRTVKARVTIDNGSGLLKPGMFASASINSFKDAQDKKAILVPEEAVFLDGSGKYVFTREGNGRFVAKEVSTGPASGDKVEIKDGLRAGDVIAIKGVFALKSELKKKTLDVHEH